MCRIELLVVTLLAAGPLPAVTVNTVDGPEEMSILPVGPDLTIGSVEQLREHYDEVRDALPPLPFRFGDQWLVPDGEGGFRTLESRAGWFEQFSPNGQFIVRSGERDREPNLRGEVTRPVEISRTDGTLLWSLEQGPTYVWPTDEGLLHGVFSLPYLGLPPRRFVTYGLEGRVIGSFGTRFQVTTTTRVRYLPRLNLFIVQDREILAVTTSGEVRWRLGAEDVGDRYPLVASFGEDPLDRGLWLRVSHTMGRTSSLFIIDAATGEKVETFAEHEDAPVPNGFSADGTLAATVIGLMDWRTGAWLFRYGRDDQIDGHQVVLGGYSTCSVDPVRLAAEFSSGRRSNVFDESGRRIWYTTVSANDVLHHHLNMTGSMLGIDLSPREVAGAQPEARPIRSLLFFRLPE